MPTRQLSLVMITSDPNKLNATMEAVECLHSRPLLDPCTKVLQLEMWLTNRACDL